VEAHQREAMQKQSPSLAQVAEIASSATDLGFNRPEIGNL
jgi:hypothetical protein